LFQALASQVDTVASFTVHDAATRDFIRRFLGADQYRKPPETAQSTLLGFNDSTAVSSHHVLAAAQILFRYSLLDTCADVFDLARRKPQTLSSTSPQSVASVEKLQKVWFDKPQSITTLY
jgi:hypothetical protein